MHVNTKVRFLNRLVINDTKSALKECSHQVCKDCYLIHMRFGTSEACHICNFLQDVNKKDTDYDE